MTKEHMMAKRKNGMSQSESLIKQAKDTMALGTLTTIGTYGFTRVGSNHPAVYPATSSIVSGLQLTNVGNLANIGLNLAKSMQPPKKKKT